MVVVAWSIKYDVVKKPIHRSIEGILGSAPTPQQLFIILNVNISWHSLHLLIRIDINLQRKLLWHLNQIDQLNENWICNEVALSILSISFNEMFDINITMAMPLPPKYLIWQRFSIFGLNRSVHGIWWAMLVTMTHIDWLSSIYDWDKKTHTHIVSRTRKYTLKIDMTIWNLIEYHSLVIKCWIQFNGILLGENLNHLISTFQHIIQSFFLFILIYVNLNWRFN